MKGCSLHKCPCREYEKNDPTKCEVCGGNPVVGRTLDEVYLCKACAPVATEQSAPVASTLPVAFGIEERVEFSNVWEIVGFEATADGVKHGRFGREVRSFPLYRTPVSAGAGVEEWDGVSSREWIADFFRRKMQDHDHGTVTLTLTTRECEIVAYALRSQATDTGAK